jgi:hypothetical protein
MPCGIVVCACPQRRARLLKVARTRKQTGEGSVKEFSTAEETMRYYAAGADSAEFVLLGLTEQERRTSDLVTLRDGLRTAPVIVELAGDEPTLVFELLRAGAFDVRAQYPVRSEKLWKTILCACGGGPQAAPPYQKLLPMLKLDKKGHWGFLSMTFENKDETTDDYHIAICTAWRALKLPDESLQRADQIEHADLDMRRRVQEALKQRSVLVALLSTPDRDTLPNPNVMYEIGYAEALGKPVLCLWRDTGYGMPAVCDPLLHVPYSNRTELALALFFGLGGTRELLRQSERRL